MGERSEKKHKKHSSKDKKHSKKSKRSRREYSSSDDEGQKRAKLARMTDKIAEHQSKITMVSAYPDADNPFDDPTLSKRFVWKKKIASDLQSGKDIREFTVTSERDKQAARMTEIDKVKQRRQEREEELARMEEELGVLDRQRAAVEASHLAEKEGAFHLEQAKARSFRKVREGRASPLDVCVKNLLLGGDFEVDVAAPYEILEGLNLSELQELQEGIEMYQELDTGEPQHAAWWGALLDLVAWQIQEMEFNEQVDRAALRGDQVPEYIRQQQAMHTAVSADVEAEFMGLTHPQLQEMEVDMQAAQADDPEFYTAALERLKVHKARAQLRDIHGELMEASLKRKMQASHGTLDVPTAMGWKASEGGPGEQAAAPTSPLHPSNAQGERDALPEATAAPAAAPPPAGEAAASGVPGPQLEGGEGSEGEDEDGQPEWLRLSDGRYSPPPVDMRLLVGQEVVPEADDARLLQVLRRQELLQTEAEFAAGGGAGPDLAEGDGGFNKWVSGERRAPHRMVGHLGPAEAGGPAFRSGVSAKDDVADEEMRRLQARASRMMESDAPDDRTFTGQVALESRVYWWHQKYRARKPKFFNRVHTGFEWNKYNQTHYDSDNPPPKVVQGYKFNIFYHQLIDPTVAPSYTVETDPSAVQDETCILRFSAGPPYEDIAFRVVNKEWEYGHKRGFKCTFERGIMHLYFNFKRLRYRR